MTTYDSRKLRRRRTRRELWEQYRPAVIALEVVALVTLLWWPLHLLGLV